MSSFKSRGDAKLERAIRSRRHYLRFSVVTVAAVLFCSLICGKIRVNVGEASSEWRGKLSVELSPTQALSLWHRVVLAQVEDDAPDMTSRQLAILLHIYLVPPPHTVRGLASVLGVTKPVITRALDSMGAIGLVERERDQRDKRNVVIKRTVAGALYLEKLGDLIIHQARKA